MENLNIRFPSKINNNIFQQITGSYYLIPNIKKCLKKILEIINCGLSLYGGSIYYSPSNEKKIIIKDYSHKAKNHFSLKFSEIAEIIFKENFPNINCTKREQLDIDLEACIIPIRYDSNFFGIIILFGDDNSFSPENLIEDSIGAYVTAACIGNRLIIAKEVILNKFFGCSIVNQEISVKILLEWRIQELTKNFFDQLPYEQNICQEISRETEKTLISTVLKKSDNNQSRAAKYLGINRNTLRKKIKELNIN